MECLNAGGSRSPVIFIHGFPDSPRMFADYVSAAEQAQPWLQERAVYTFAFPNRFTHPEYMTALELMRGAKQRAFDAALQERIAASPTGQVIVVAHDWGATCTWDYIRHHDGAGIEKLVAFSVGSSFRWDVWEHGLNAFTWLYSVFLILAHVLPIPAFRRFVAHIWATYSGYRSEQAETLHKDCYHYWYGLLLPFTLVFQLAGVRYRPAYTAFRFPVLYMRSHMDRIASTKAFEQYLQTRADCRLVVVPNANHWFPEQQAETVLPVVRAFIQGG